MANVIDGKQRAIAEIKLDGERAYPITHAETVVVKEGPSTGSNKGVFLNEKLADIDSKETQLEQSIVNEINRASQIEAGISTNVNNIEKKIPTQASESNKLADKAFVNSSIATATATFRGTHNLVTNLNLPLDATQAQKETTLGSAVAIADNNDYAFILIPTSTETPNQIRTVERYKYNGTGWKFEYELNSSGFTAAQWAAINSGITQSDWEAMQTNVDSKTISQFSASNATGNVVVSIMQQDMTIALTTTLPTATSSLNGVMASADKDKLNTYPESYSTVSTAIGNKYTKPSGGIPKTDLAQDVKDSLSLANSALQASDISGKADIIELNNYVSSQSVLPIGGKAYVYYGKPVEIKVSKIDGDNKAILFIVDRYPENEDVNTITVLEYVQSGGGDNDYVFSSKYTSLGNAPLYIRLACGVVTATQENDGLMSYQDKEKLDSFEIVVASSKYEPETQSTQPLDANFDNN